MSEYGGLVLQWEIDPSWQQAGIIADYCEENGDTEMAEIWCDVCVESKLED